MIEWWWIPLSFVIYYMIGILVLTGMSIFGGQIETLKEILSFAFLWPVVIAEGITELFKHIDSKFYFYSVTILSENSNMLFSDTWCKKNISSINWRKDYTSFSSTYHFRFKSDHCAFCLNCV